MSMNIHLSSSELVYVAHVFSCTSKSIYCGICGVVLKLLNAGIWQRKWNSLTVDCVLMTKTEENDTSE